MEDMTSNSSGFRSTPRWTGHETNGPFGSRTIDVLNAFPKKSADFQPEGESVWS